MILVRIYLHPQGDASRERLLGTLSIANDTTGTEARGNYCVLAEDRSGAIHRGAVHGFARQRLNHWVLVKRALSSIFEGREPRPRRAQLQSHTTEEP